VHIKGTAIRSRLEFVKAGAGPAGLESTLAALPAEDRHILEVALPTSWIPIEVVDRLDLEIARQSGGIDVAREYGAFSARRNLSRVYKLFIDQAQGDPLSLLEGLASLHSSFYDKGGMRVEDPQTGCCRVQLDFVGAAARFRCQVSRGFLEEALRMLNVGGLQVREESCQVWGAHRCSLAFQWSPVAEPRRSMPAQEPGVPRAALGGFVNV
jgi:hypothetical protein